MKPKKSDIWTSEGCGDNRFLGWLYKPQCNRSSPSPHPQPHQISPALPPVRAFEAASANTDSHLTLGARIEFPLEPCIFNHHRASHTHTHTHTQTHTHRSTSSRGVGRLNKQMCGNKHEPVLQTNRSMNSTRVTWREIFSLLISIGWLLLNETNFSSVVLTKHCNLLHD